MNFGELKQQIADYGHRTDAQTINQIPFFVELATKRIGRDLMALENTIVLDPYVPIVEDESGIAPLPDDYRHMKEISYLQSTRRVQLRGGSVDALARYPQSAVGSVLYKVHGRAIEIKPFSERDYRLIYYAQPKELVEDTDTNAVLDNYPYLYVYAGLVELFFFIQMGGAHTSSLENYTSEITETNRQGANASMGGQMTIG